MEEAKVWEALHQVLDPELGINIVDLGLVYSVEVEGGSLRVALTLTTPSCPLQGRLRQEAEKVLCREFPEARSVEVRFVWDPPWHPMMMSEEAKRRLGWREG